MEKIQQYCNKKNLYIGAIVGGIIAAILFIIAININSTVTSMKTISDLNAFYSELNGLMSVIKNFCNIYYLDFVLLLVVTGTYGIRLFKLKDQTLDTKILLGVSVGTLLLCVISFNTISTIKAVGSGKFSNAYGLGDIGELKLVFFMLLLQVASACYAGFLLFKNKGTQQVDTASTTTETKASEPNGETVSAPKISIVEKFKTYYATSNGKKNVFIGGAVVAVVLIAVIGLSVFNSLKRTPIDLTKNCQVSFEGVSGKGNAKVNCKADYDMSNTEIAAFVNSITYEVKDNGTLKNGDTIQIKAKYSEATADSLKLKPENTTKKEKVEGLEVAYMEFKDVPKDISSKFETATKEKLETEIKQKVGGFFNPKSRTTDKIECIATYYKYSSGSVSGTAYYIYRMEETIQHNSTRTEKQVNYYYVSIGNINSREEVDLATTSDYLDYGLISYYGNGNDEKTDENYLNSFKTNHKGEGIQVVKENPSTLTYKNETVKE